MGRLGFLRTGAFGVPLALVTIMAAGGLLTGAFYASSRPVATLSPAELEQEARVLAKRGLEDALGPGGVPSERTMWPVLVYRSAGGAAAASYLVTARPVRDSLMLVTSHGRVRAGDEESIQTLRTLVRAPRPSL